MKAAMEYRNLLRAVKKHVANDESKKHFTEYVIEEFRKPLQQDLTSVGHRTKLAQDYTYYLNSVHHHQDLLFSYNIAVDRTDEMKRVLKKSAASVGLQLPEPYQP